jgi:DNA-binding MarR family transcriptional regulator
MLVEPLARQALNFTQWMALSTLGQRGPCSMSELAQGAAVDRTSMTRIVDGLTSRGLAARWTPPQDRRTVLAEATPEGKRLVGAVQADVVLLEERLFLDCGVDDRDHLARGLEKILAGASRGGLASQGKDALEPLTRRSRLG